MRETVVDLTGHEATLIELEKLHFEARSRENIIAYMINNNQISTDAFKQYSKDYAVCIANYEKLKKSFVEKEMGVSGNVSWSIDFDLKEMKLVYNE